jgi:CheY-like chemotaxis protein
MKKRLHILLIDDDSDDHIIFEEILNVIDANINCSHAYTAYEGIKMVESIGEEINYIFLDLNMPMMDGKECLAELKKRCNIPTIIFTTSCRKTDIDDAQKLGAQWYLIKSNSFTGLQKSIGLILQAEKAPNPAYLREIGVRKF